MFDVLPRLHLLKNCSLKFEDIDLFFVDCSNADFHVEALVAAGVNHKKIYNDFSKFHVEAEYLIVPSLPGITGNMPFWACEYLRDTFLKIQGNKTGRKIYISRERATHRKMINECDVIDLIEKAGFEIITPEKYTVNEQASIFSAAEIVIAPHGAGLTNLVFCNPGTRVLEMFPPDYINVCYWALSNQMSLEYFYAVGTQSETGSSGSVNKGDFYIDISVIENGLRQIGL